MIRLNTCYSRHGGYDIATIGWRQLVRQARNNNGGFVALINRLDGVINELARNLAGDCIEDAKQEARLAVWQKLKQVRLRMADEQINQWLVNAAKHAIRHEAYRQYKQTRLLNYTDEDQSETIGCNERMTDRLEHMNLQTYLYRLKTQIDKYKLLLRYAPVIRAKGQHRRRDFFKPVRAQMKADAKIVPPPVTVKRMLDKITSKGDRRA